MKIEYEKPVVKISDGFELLRLKRLPHEEYLKTDYWQHVRKLVVKYYRYSCMLCSGRNILDVHHRHYETKGQERIGDLTLLCRNCHARFHDKTDEDNGHLYSLSDFPDQHCIKCGNPKYINHGNEIIQDRRRCELGDESFESTYGLKENS